MQIIIDIPENTIRNLSIRAEKDGRTLKQYLSRGIEFLAYKKTPYQVDPEYVTWQKAMATKRNPVGRRTLNEKNND